ncbi:chemotaxis protein CheW [Acidovorax sp. Be4]|uniref:Chemotaxis protein CheW n=1 Tax=Acidovorax bellezanensis TaxID=2976702 RepID=A0ABT2PRN9_9BURK|nr:chemotaxis protein CheW [Acidovorax sp. Be4]MCT9811952.1 chemotaxis protein CheW [Acidovorax sp. Be4]
MPGEHDDATDSFIPFMRKVARCEDSLRELRLMWRLIESSAKMNCPDEALSILPMMAATRESFQQLEADLVQSLVAESLGEVMREIGTQAKHVIDILVRNLYERTADVGFLATDAALCRLAAGLDQDAEAVRARLRQYRNKYTVYDDILVLDVQGQVLAQIDEDAPLAHSRDPLIVQTLRSPRHVETFRASDLRPGKRHALLYSQRLLHPLTGETVGVLCLSFAFDDELQGIFHAHAPQDCRSLRLLVDARQQVLASSDPQWLPPGVRVPVNPSGAAQLWTHSGRTYLVQTAHAADYQGYPGPPGWQGQVMVPVEQAFLAKASRSADGVPPHILQGLLGHARHFCAPLHDIVTAADTIRRVVWNGQVMTAGQRDGAQRLAAVLEQISETGARTNEVFGQAIGDLCHTVLSSAMRDGEFLSQLLVDLLDRNLYERANDCRWWALTPELRSLLTDAHGDEEVARAQAVLEQINALYTVYSRLVVYDTHGRIIAASHPQLADGSSALGQQVEADALAAVLALPDTQAYYASPWRASALSDGAATYIFHAAIRASDSAQTVGGIGIVFNAADELTAMLASTASGGQHCASVFVDRSGRVLASSPAPGAAGAGLPAMPVGARLALPADMLQLPVGKSLSRAMVHDGHYCIVGCSVTQGYREFRADDDAPQAVLALSFASFGAQLDHADAAVQRRDTSVLGDSSATPQGTGREMATFFVDTRPFALDAACVLEALPASAITPVSAGRMPYCLGTLARRTQGAVTGYVWVFDLGQLLRGTPSTLTAQSQVIVVEAGGRRIGLLVSDLLGVQHFSSQRFFAAPHLGGAGSAVVGEIIQARQADGTGVLVQCLDVEALVRQLQTSAAGQRSLHDALQAAPQEAAMEA